MNTELVRYSRVKAIVLKMYGGGVGIDVFIRLSEGKYIKVCHKHEPHEKILKKYYSRGVDDFFLTEPDYRAFVATVKAKLLRGDVDSGNNADADERQLQILNAAHQVLRTVFSDGYVNEEGKELAKAVTQGTVASIRKGKFFKKFMQFKTNCSAEYLHAVVTSFIACNLVNEFPWGNDSIKEKIVMGALLCDILLQPEDFNTIYRLGSDIKSLPTHIYHHPSHTADIIGKETRFVAPETLTIIRQHHERPNGKGYPSGENYGNISILSAIYIVANYFVEQLFSEDCTEGISRVRMDKIVEQIMEKFHSGNFKKASEALQFMMSEREEFMEEIK